MASVTVTPGGSSPLVALTLVPPILGGSAARAFQIDVLNGTAFESSTGVRLGKTHILPLGSTASRNYRTAVKDSQSGLWSEWSGSGALAVANFTAGSTEAGINGATDFQNVGNPGFLFPDLSMGSGTMSVRKTYVSASGTFIDEVRGQSWGRGITVFSCVLKMLDESQSQCLVRFFNAVNGNQSSFFFDYVDPQRGSLTTGRADRYLVRFRDPNLQFQAFDVTYFETSFALAEVLEDPETGDLA